MPERGNPSRVSNALPNWRRISATVCVAVLVAFGITGTVLAFKWPFTPARISHSLSAATGSRVQFTDATLLFFPSPGFECRNLELRRGSDDATPLVTVPRFRVTASWGRMLMLQHRIEELEAERLVMRLPAPFPPRDPTAPPPAKPTEIGRLKADGATVERSPERRFHFERLKIENLNSGTPMRFSTVLQNAYPRSRVTAAGTFGPWNGSEGVDRMPVSGSFEISDADLAQYKGLGGILHGTGKVKGTFSQMQVRGSVDVTGFEVDHNGHKMPVRAGYTATVNGRSGDTVLNSVDARVLETALRVHGSIRSSGPGNGKTAELDFASDNARIQDLLRLATSSQPPALSGPMSLRAHVVLPPDDQPFLRKVRLTGHFEIVRARFNRAGSQRKLDALSSSARDDDNEDDADPEHVVSELNGSVDLRNGIAELRDARFAVPGAAARGGGVYNVITKNVDLQGTVEMAATVSEASHGLKSILLKPFDHLFRDHRRDRGAELPVRITGRYPNAKFQVSLVGKKRRG